MKVLQITTTNAKLAIESVAAKINVEGTSITPQIKTTPAAPQIQTSKTTFKNNVNVLPITGLPTQLNTFDLQAQEGVRTVQEFTVRAVEEGNQMMRIENGGNPIPDISVQRMASREREINVASNPVMQNTIQWDVGSVKLDWSPTSVEISWEVSDSSSITVTPHSVKIYMQEWPKVEIKVVDGVEFVPNVGTKVDETL